jgi:glycogen debranching enzyme
LTTKPDRTPPAAKPAPANDDEILEHQDQFYILATSSRSDDRTRVLKHGVTFAVFDRFGDLQPLGMGEQGVYHDGTRFLSRLELRVGNRRPLLLSSTVTDDNDLLTVDLTNPDIESRDAHLKLPRGHLHVFRTKFLWRGSCHERVRISNFAMRPLATELTLSFDADYADVFEVRGSKREHRGRRLPSRVGPAEVVLGYQGLDDATRQTRISFQPAPSSLAEQRATFDLHLAPGESFLLHVAIDLGFAAAGDEVGIRFGERFGHDEALAGMRAERHEARSRHASVRSDNAQLNDVMARSMADLHMMTTHTPTGPYPFAGVPWFSTPFGRDGIITALEMLWLDPGLAIGVLKYLAATQARTSIPAQDAEPGKILHEARHGEMAALREVPFGRYYGSVDATPLFVMLAGETFRRTGDRELATAMWPHVVRALDWIDGDGDHDGDGFVEYARHSPNGLVQQGWKDSGDSVFHADGTMAEPPIALCEVQGYVYAARHAAALIARALGKEREAKHQEHAAEKLQAAFEQKFWSERLGSYVLALDGHKRPCEVVASNAGHALYAGIAAPERARRTAETLLAESSHSGWGIRTLAASEVRYNPMSYHNGSVWPHDNAIVAAGFSRYGMREEVHRLLDALLIASSFLDLDRIPELYCGFPRRPGEGPTLYPVACAPQSWAAGAIFMMIQACLGLSIDGHKQEVSLFRPLLPASIATLRISDVRVGNGSVDLLLENHLHDVGLTVLRRDGDVQVVVSK